MPPNSVVIPVGPETTNIPVGGKGPGVPELTNAPQRYEEPNYNLMIFLSVTNSLAHILIGMILAISYCYAFRSGIPLRATPQHVVLCVTGYQLLMAEGFLSLANHNGWTVKFRLVDKRRAHWVLQILGSGLAIAGSFIKILDKDVHFNSLHGQFALVALVFTTVSLVNGLTSLWSYELRRIIPANLSKLTHICFGTVGFAASCISLIYGFDYNMFRNWAYSSVADATIAFVVILMVIVIFNPLIVFYKKSFIVIKGSK